jgi:S-disulfanyl-L-cysteine oxidoreductase SoxD
MAMRKTAVALCTVIAVQAFGPASDVVRAGVEATQFGLGRPPTADEMKGADVDVLPDGRGLPPGSGTAERGRDLYARRCAACHGASGKEGPADILVGGNGSLATARPLKTVGSFWPYATTLWDYINRSMPYDRPGTLTADEVYAVTAFVLNLNGIVGDGEALTQETLPRVRMPNRDGFIR